MENYKQIELQLEQAVLESKPELFNFVSFQHDNKEKFGIVLEQFEYNQPLSVIVPLFEKENDAFSLLTNADNIVLQDSDIKSVLDKQQGLDTWKNVILSTGSNPTLELEAKLQNFMPKVVGANLASNNFSFKKAFDDCIQQNQQMLSQLSANVPLEKIFDKVVNEVVNHSITRNYRQNKKSNSNLTNINEIQFQKLDLKNQIISVLESINNENRNDDILFVNNFKQRFEKDSISKEDVNNLLARIMDVSNGQKTSDIINDFVEKKKTEILDSKNLHIPIHTISNEITESSNLDQGDRVGVIISDKYYYGNFIKIDEESNTITIKDEESKKIDLPFDESTMIYQLFESQQFLELHLKEKFAQEMSLINWDDLSFENQLQLLKGQNTELLTGVDNSSKDDLQFKIYVHQVENDIDLKAHVHNPTGVDLNNYKFKSVELSEKQRKELENNEVIVFEVFDKDGTLQFAHDMKYDRDLNDVVVSPDKGINYAKNIKEGKKKGFYAKTTIENKGKSTTPKV